MNFRQFNVRRDPQCPVCGETPTITAPIDYEQFCGLRANVPEISVQELKQKLDRHESIELIDVREPFEYEIARIDGAKLIPLGELSRRLNEIRRDGQAIVHCHSGVRSAQAVEILRQAGFSEVFNLAGGIDAWADQIDPAVPKY
jgi:rhodanese-related sulfurtransferase